MKGSLIKYIFSLVLAAFLCGYAFAEVSGEVDANGNYLRTIYIEKATGKALKIWTVFGNKPTLHPLNPSGDLNGDLKPVIRENIFGGNLPHVAWPKWDGNDYEIAYSQWIGAGWSPIAYVEDRDNIYNDLDPSLIFNTDGRAYLTWWRDEDSCERIYFSVFLKTRWMDPLPISDENVNSWDPEISFNSNGQIEISYSTAAGIEKKIIVMHFPDTITDDIDPFGTGLVEVNEESADELTMQ